MRASPAGCTFGAGRAHTLAGEGVGGGSSVARGADLRDEPADVAADAAVGERVVEAAVAAELDAEEEGALVIDDVEEVDGQGCARVNRLHNIVDGQDLVVRVA